MTAHGVTTRAEAVEEILERMHNDRKLLAEWAREYIQKDDEFVMALNRYFTDTMALERYCEGVTMLMEAAK